LLTEHNVAAAAHAAGLPGPASFVETTGSTNADLMAAADAGAPEWSVLVAGHQTAGRGRLGRAWEEPPGSSLLVSVLLRPAMPPDQAPLASLAGGLAVAEAVGVAAAGIPVRCEWPNDVVSEHGRKLAGVLVESRVEGDRLRHLVIGAGINLTQRLDDFPDDARVQPTSLTIEGAPADAQGLLAEYLRRLAHWYDPSGFQSSLLDAFRQRCATIGRRVRATTTDGTVVDGEATAIGERGELIVATRDGRSVAVSSGELVRLG
jgi:BirA family biotin operon repressor/biotin-[acetyl-CoA-carboxylase] ligase